MATSCTSSRDIRHLHQSNPCSARKTTWVEKTTPWTTLVSLCPSIGQYLFFPQHCLQCFGSLARKSQLFGTHVVHTVHFGSSREGCGAAGWIRHDSHLSEPSISLGCHPAKEHMHRCPFWENRWPWSMESNQPKPVPSISSQNHLKRTPMNTFQRATLKTGCLRPD